MTVLRGQLRPLGQKRARTRRVLLATTLQVLAEGGVASASVERIARRAGVSRAAIYDNFADRDALLLAAAGPAAVGLEAVLADGAPLKAQLRRLAETLVDHFTAPGSPVAAYQLHAVQSPESRARLAAAYWQVFERIAARLAGEDWQDLALAARALTLRLLWQAVMADGRASREAAVSAFEALAGHHEGESLVPPNGIVRREK